MFILRVGPPGGQIRGAAGERGESGVTLSFEQGDRGPCCFLDCVGWGGVGGWGRVLVGTC